MYYQRGTSLSLANYEFVILTYSLVSGQIVRPVIFDAHGRFDFDETKRPGRRKTAITLCWVGIFQTSFNSVFCNNTASECAQNQC